MTNKLLVFCIIISFGLLLQFVPLLNISFDYASLAKGESKSEVSSFYEKQQNNLSVIISKKNKNNFSQEELCQIKKVFNSPPDILNLKSLNNPFSFSLPYMDEKKLLFQALIELDCHELKSSNTLSSLGRLEIFKDFSNDNFSDILFQLKFAQKNSKRPKYNYLLIETKKWLNQKLDNKYDIHFEGTPLLLHYIEETLIGDWRVNVLLILIFGGLFYLFYAKFYIIFLYLSSLFITSSILLPLFSLFDVTLNPLTSSLFIILAIASIEDFIFVVNDLSFSQDTKTTINKFKRSSFLTSITTIIGFGSLYLSPIRDIQYFGLFTALGALIEWFVIFYVLPKSFNHLKVTIKYQNILEKMAIIKPGRGFFYLSIIPFLLSFFFLTKLDINEKSSQLFSEDHAYSQDSAYLEETRSWQRRIYVKVDKKKNVLIIKEHAQSIDGIDQVLEYQSYIQEITKKLSLDAANLVTRQMKNGELYNQLHYKNNPIMVIYLKDSSIESMRNIVLKLDTYCKQMGCEVFGRQAEYTRYNKNILLTLYRSFGFSLGLIAAFIFILSFIKLKKVNFLILYSALWGPILMILLFYLFNIPLNFTSCIFFSVFIGLAGDNAIQFLMLADNLSEIKINKLAQSSIMISIFSILGSLALVISGFEFTATLGSVFSLGFTVNLIGDLYLLKSGLKKQERSY